MNIEAASRRPNKRIQRSAGSEFGIVPAVPLPAPADARRWVLRTRLVHDMRIKFPALAFGIFSVAAFAFGESQKQAVKPSPSEQILTVDFCELAKHPTNYVNKIVRVEANYIGWWESSYLYGDACNEAKYKIHNALDCPGDGMCLDCTPGDDTCKNKYEEVWNALAPYFRSDKNKFASRVRGVLVGRLIGPGHFGHLSGFDYEFRIRAVEKGMAVPDNVPW